ncbi:uncharacterized protein LOC130531227 isoform X2 [Takifugu flavidus]|uniref:uncharacterized protein LOC130531227 isoform X2 n=1 Tax=Takifugu flavidus TaxID=433684 RepID=UPI002544B636|nr:uncharacterized protein LOC130531227 isoform X2 [Takifugu flavidus]
MLHHMIGGLAALILLSKLSQNEDVPHKIPVRVVNQGDNVTLTCPASADITGFFLHKIKFGYLAQTFASGYSKVSLRGQFNTSRFTATTENSLHLFKIRNASKEDEATYLCQAGTAYDMSFTNGTVLIVNDHKGQNSLQVKQSKSVHPGGSVTLQCSLHSKKEKKQHTCPAEDNVYWIRLGSGESHPSIIYTPSHSSCEGEERSCFYTLSKTVNVSDKGTYYCAVDMCGQILFGGGTTQLPNARVQFVVVIGILSVCCVLLLAALIICSKRKPAVLTTGDPHSSAEDHLEDGELREESYVTLNFPSRKKRHAAKGELPPECIYSGVRG